MHPHCPHPHSANLATDSDYTDPRSVPLPPSDLQIIPDPLPDSLPHPPIVPPRPSQSPPLALKSSTQLHAQPAESNHKLPTFPALSSLTAQLGALDHLHRPHFKLPSFKPFHHHSHQSNPRPKPPQAQPIWPPNEWFIPTTHSSYSSLGTTDGGSDQFPQTSPPASDSLVRHPSQSSDVVAKAESNPSPPTLVPVGDPTMPPRLTNSPAHTLSIAPVQDHSRLADEQNLAERVHQIMDPPLDPQSIVAPPIQPSVACEEPNPALITDPPVNARSIAPTQTSGPEEDSPQMMDSPTNTQSIALPQLQLPVSSDSGQSHQITGSPLNARLIGSTQTAGSAANSPEIMDSPMNTQSIAPCQEQASAGSEENLYLISDSPGNTQSIAPTLPPGLAENSPQMVDSPLNTQSIGPGPNQVHSGGKQSGSEQVSKVTTMLPDSKTGAATLAPPPTVPTPLPPRRALPFRPPPAHPSIQLQRTGGAVKETLDAHSSLSVDGEKQVNQYIIKGELGRGSFGAVQLAVDGESGLEYAIKELSKSRLKKKFAREMRILNQSYDDNDALFLIRNEVAIMKKVRHPNVVKLHEVLDVAGEDSLYMVMEYCRGGSLMRRDPARAMYEPNAGLEPDVARKYFRQLIVGIDYLHRNEIIHHDIKPDNILLSSDRKQIKVVDFGISAMFSKAGDDSSVSRTIGSPAFLSPELVRAEPETVVSGTASDIWAMGVTLYCMLTGKLPFGHGQIMDMYEAIEHEAPPVPDEWEPSLVDLFSRILDKDPQTRIKMKALMSHPWVTDSGRLAALDSGPDDVRINRTNTERELKESFRAAISNHCPLTKNLFKEILEDSWRYCWKSANVGGQTGAGAAGGHHPQGRRREFLKEFYRQIGERAVGNHYTKPT